MTTVSRGRATLDDLYTTEGKAELIGGQVASLPATGHRPNKIAGRIFRSLDEFSEDLGHGEALTDNMGFAVPELSSGRESFSPDAAWYDGPLPGNLMRFVEGPPAFAAEVRSEGDYGDVAESEMAAKRADYFEAGTQVVWDVDPIAEHVDVYRRSDPEIPQRFVRGEVADAEPAVPGWRMEVDGLFR